MKQSILKKKDMDKKCKSKFPGDVTTQVDNERIG